MPFPAVKMFLSEKKITLDAAIAAASIVNAVRAVDMDASMNPADDDAVFAMAIASGGSPAPASGAKTADLQFLVVESEISSNDATDLAKLQLAVDNALADAVHELGVVADGVTTVPGTVTSAAGIPFAAEDVGRKIRIGSEVRTITGFTSTSNVQYDDVAEGAFTPGVGLSIDMLGAEVLQDVNVSTVRDPQGKYRVLVVLTVEGEAN